MLNNAYAFTLICKDGVEPLREPSFVLSTRKKTG